MRIFRFETLSVWQYALEISDELLDVAVNLSERHYYRFAEQLRGATMSITNNIAEGSGADNNKEFDSFLRYSRRSAFECANILLLCVRKGLVEEQTKDVLHEKLDILCRQITRFRQSLKR